MYNQPHQRGQGESSLPLVIQGGMGIYVFPWDAARKVSLHKRCVGTVSGTGMHLVLPRLLQLGDEGGHYRRALKAFPDQEMAERILKRYFVSGGIPPTKPFKNVEQFSLNPSRNLIELTIVANFCQVWLAGEGHDGNVGVNFLEKVQLPHLSAIYGVLLAANLIAGDVYLMIGAGIAMQIPGVLDKLTQHELATYNTYVINADKNSTYQTHFCPRDFLHCALPELKRPLFYPVIGSSSLAQIMTKSGQLRIDGWIVEYNEFAGGHSAPPRGRLILNEAGEPLYGIRDEIDFGQLNDISLPYYLAGAFASPEKLAYALSVGAAGIQVGSIFALCDDSKINAILRAYMRKEGYNGRLVVFNDLQASPAGFPFKVVRMPNTLGDPLVYNARKRICDLGGLLQPYLRDDGTVGYRCPAEPIQSYLKKGGKLEDTENTLCLCNGLHSIVDLGQRLQDGTLERPVPTLGKNLSFLRHVMSHENDNYSIEDAIRYLFRDQKSTL